MSGKRRGFTLIELLVVLSVIALLLAIVTPNTFKPLARSKDVVLHKDLQSMRDAIDHYYGDKNRYPASLQALVSENYLHAVPIDPITDSAATWIIVPPPSGESGAVYDVHSGAAGTGPNETVPYSQW